MAISSGSNISSIQYIFRNEDHRTNIGLDTYVGVQFPDIGFIKQPGDVPSNFTLSGWFHITNDSADTVWEYVGPGPGELAPFIRIETVTKFGGNDLYFTYNLGGGVDDVIRKIDNTALGNWMYICYRRYYGEHTIWTYREDKPDPIKKNFQIGPPTIPHIEFAFDHFRLNLFKAMSFCNLKLWNVALTDDQIEENRKIWLNPTIDPAPPMPLWMAHMRRPGDVYNSSAGVPNDFWHDNFEWTFASDPSFTVYFTDPIELQKKPCSTYLIPVLGVENALPRVADFQCPIGLHTRYAPENTYFQIDDRSTVPINYSIIPPADKTIYDGAILYGYAPYQGIKKQIVPAGSVAASISHVAHISPLGVKSELGNIQDQSGFEIRHLLTGYDPLDIDKTSLKIEEIYLWKWGAGFSWNNTLGVTAKAYPGEYRQPVILVTYRGTWALEVPELSAFRISQLPVEIAISPKVGPDSRKPPTIDPPEVTPTVPGIGGIYFFNPIKTYWHDSYYPATGTTVDIEKKIPDPTIKTALIGE